jgi:hypothetical protein
MKIIIHDKYGMNKKSDVYCQNATKCFLLISRIELALVLGLGNILFYK